MTNKLTRYAKAAQHLPMAWLAQGQFPAKALVEEAFLNAVEELPKTGDYQDDLVRSGLQRVLDGPDPRGGTFKAHAIYAAAQLHDRITALALEPKAKKSKVHKGSIIHGYAGGLFGRDSYGHRKVLDKGKDWVNYVYVDGPWTGMRGTYNGDLGELVEYLVPDQHCEDDCTFGQD